MKKNCGDSTSEIWPSEIESEMELIFKKGIIKNRGFHGWQLEANSVPTRCPNSRERVLSWGRFGSSLDDGTSSSSWNRAREPDSLLNLGPTLPPTPLKIAVNTCTNNNSGIKSFWAFTVDVPNSSFNLA